MKIKLTLITIVTIAIFGFGLANTIYAQGPDDGEPTTPCEFYAIMHDTEDCPFEDIENWTPGWMMGYGDFPYQSDDQTMMPFGGRGMMGMGLYQGMMNNRQGMMNMWNTDIETMPYFGMHQGMMSNWWWSGNVSEDSVVCPFWNNEAPETTE